MALRIPRACRYSFSIDLRAGAFLAMAASMVGLCSAVLRKTLDAPAWLIIVIQSIQTGSMLLAPAWAGAAIFRQKVPLISGGAIVSALLLLLTALSVPAVRALLPTYFQYDFFGATPDILLFALLLVFVYCSVSGFLALMAAVYRQNYPVTLRAQIVSRATVVKLLAGQSLLIAANFILDIEHDIFIYLLILGSGLYLLGAAIYSQMHVMGEMTLPRGVNWPEMKRRILPGDVYKLLRRNPHYRRFQFCQTLHGSGNLMCGPAYLLVMIDILKLSYLEIALISSVIPAVGNIVSTFRWAPLVDRLSPCRARVKNSPLWIAGLVLFPLSVYLPGFNIALPAFNAGPLSFHGFAFYLPSSIWAWISFTCTGLAMGGSGLLWSLGPLYYAGKDDATMFSAAHSFLTGVRGFVFIVLGGFVYQLVGLPVFFIGGAMITTAMYLFHRQDKVEQRDHEFLSTRLIGRRAPAAPEPPAPAPPAALRHD